MKLPIHHSRFHHTPLVVERTGLFRGPRVWLNHHLVRGEKRRDVVTDDDEGKATVELKPTFFDPVPQASVDGEQVILARRMRWYEYAWLVLPMLLVFSGGALGALACTSPPLASRRLNLLGLA